jgi:hypothetical protein
VRKDRGSGGVKRRVVVGVVEVPVSVDDPFHWRVAQTIESLLEPGPRRRNESVHDEFAVWTVEDYHASARAGEHSDVVSKLLCFKRSGVELGAHTREQDGRRRRLSRVARCGGAQQKGAAGRGGRS